MSELRKNKLNYLLYVELDSFAEAYLKAATR